MPAPAVALPSPLRTLDALRHHPRTAAADGSRQLGEILVAAGAISARQLDAALAAQRHKRQRLGELLLAHGVIPRETLLQALAARLGVPYVVLTQFTAEHAALDCLPSAHAREQQALPLLLDGQRLVLAIADPTNIDQLSLLGFLTGKVIECCIADAEDLTAAISRHYDSREVEAAITQLEEQPPELLDNPRLLAIEPGSDGEAEHPVIQLVHNVISDAVMRGASDIHFKPREHDVELMFRVDGTLLHVRSFSIQLLPAVVSRIKILGNMDISEHRVPQDGRCRLQFSERHIDLRLSIIPTLHGPSVVIRLLDIRNTLKDLESLGFEKNDARRLRHLLSRSSGMLLVTGPTGSGKSTTLYTALDHIRASNVNIITVEDPVEYHINGITQIQVNHETGYTFARALRHILRHDPDVIMVGEIRDQETAKMAVESALTGHLVLSTLHTNDAASSVTRLFDIGIEPYLLRSVLNGVLAQRLMRRNCPHCKEEEVVDMEIRTELGVSAGDTFWRGRGCEHCHHTGINGRMAVYELLEATPALQQLMTHNVSAAQIEAQALADGMQPLTQRALQAAREGLISLQEVYRIRL